MSVILSDIKKTVIDCLERSQNNYENRLLDSSCLYVCSHGKVWLPHDGFSLNIYFGDFLLKSVDEIQFWLKPDKNLTTLYVKAYVDFIISRLNYCSVEKASERGCRENQNTHAVPDTLSSHRNWFT